MSIEVDGLEISYKISGKGDRYAVMLQGWGTEYGIYDSVAAALAEEYVFLQFDFPGFGGSDEPKVAWNVDRYADFFCHLMEKLEIGKAVLIGHSYGGRVIIKLSSRKNLPFEIERIVLMDSAGVLPVRSFSQKIRIAQYKALKKVLLSKVFTALFPDIVEDWQMRQGSEDYRRATPVMRQCLVMAVNEDLTGLLPN
ncbi:MAG: alpha/beta hydrolase, partial [Firmicutes bacterium]|nr:alpha/beta hydrolase [Bacillota bacterium]